MDFLLAPETRPFLVAALILIALIGVELIGLLVGLSASHWIDHSIASDVDGHVAGGLDWLNAGRVPLLILIMLLLGGFAATGFIAAAVAHALWVPLPALATSAIAVVATLPVVRAASRTIARVLPHDETYAVEPADFVGRTAEVTVGPLDSGIPGRVKLLDAHGNWHFPRARAAKGQAPMAVGTTVLLVDRNGSTFLAIPAPNDLLNNR
jgi:hypothetical protein